MTHVSNHFRLMGRLNTVPWEYILLPERRFINLQYDEIKSSRGTFFTCVGFSYTKKRNPSQKNIIPWEDMVFFVGRLIYVPWDILKWSHGRFFPCVGLSYTTENHLMSWLQTIPWDGKKSHGPKWWFIIIPWDGPFLTKCHPMGSFESERMIFDRPMGWLSPCDATEQMKMNDSEQWTDLTALPLDLTPSLSQQTTPLKGHHYYHSSPSPHLIDINLTPSPTLTPSPPLMTYYTHINYT